ncbi:RNA polymerase II-associated protein 1-like [Anopheles albimanus]|uniref:RNA polymerase II-associated protein 1 C-terminal domain-containing protein n=1 Tax=Anopheles albimanus TaxID=7167 RepID=A0A182FBN0_ANOAL|nr:RNA polymerase II-associated protein 1-like [Anopheles albimanus]
MIKRPSRKDSENEILRMQQEFYAEQNRDANFQPAAKVVRVQRDEHPPPVGGGTARKSEFARRRAERQAAKEAQVPQDEQTGIESVTVDDSTSEEPAEKSFVMGCVVERVPVESFQFKETIAPDSSFPKTMHITAYPVAAVSDKPKKSLFAQMLAKDNGPAPNERNSKTNSSIHFEEPSGSALLEGWDAAEIHQENLQKLQKMSDQEIKEEQKHLLSTLDPKLVEFLKARKKPTTSSESNQSTKELKPELGQKIPQTEILPAGMEVLQQEGSEQWINFNVLEPEKLEWTKDVERSVKQLKPGESYEARFDWKGVLQPYVSEASVGSGQDDRELYLHGEDAQRPGYTLQELFRLARSNVLQQRISALGAIAGLLNILNQGFYDGVLELPVSKVFFFLRFALDENTPSVVEVASRALASLFYNETDEILLDTIFDSEYGMVQPEMALNITHGREDDQQQTKKLRDEFNALNLESNTDGRNYAHQRIKRPRYTADLPDDDPEDVHNRETMNDFHLAETDLVECLLRTNLLERIRYILFSMKPEGATVINCCKLLIRVARTNETTAMKIASNEALIGGLAKNYLTSLEGTDMDHQPQAIVIKLLRVLCGYRLDFYERYLSRYHVINLVKRYIFCRKDIDMKMIQVQIESFRFFRLLLQYKPSDELYSELWPALCYLIEWHYQYLVFDENGPFIFRQHGVALLALIGPGLQRDSTSSADPAQLANVRTRHQQLCDKLFACFSKWFSVALRTGANEFSQKLLLGVCLWTARKIRLLDEKAFETFLERYLVPFLRSERFQTIVATLGTDSLILKPLDGQTQRIPALPSLGAVQLHEHQSIPTLIVTRTYPIFLLHGLLHLLLELDAEPPALALSSGWATELRNHFWRNASHSQYIDRLASCSTSSAKAEKMKQLPPASVDGDDGDGASICNWFRQAIELRYVFDMLQLIVRETQADPRATSISDGLLLRLAFSVTFTLSEAFYLELLKLFDGIIFVKGYYGNYGPAGCPSVSQADLHRWKLGYTLLAESNMANSEMSSKGRSNEFTMAEWKKPLLARTWPYSPLYLMVEKLEKGSSSGRKEMSLFNEANIVDMALRFTELVEAVGIHLADCTERLMYLIAAFLGPDSTFLQPDFTPLIDRRIAALRNESRMAQPNLQSVFNFDATRMENKKSFYALYLLALDIFQSSSYGHAGFGSLLMAPLAQKYDVRWRNMVWSEYVAVLRFITCSAQELFDELNAYLTPEETDMVLLRSYGQALNSNLLRVGSIPHQVASHHVEAFRRRPMAHDPAGESN